MEVTFFQVIFLFLNVIIKFSFGSYCLPDWNYLSYRKSCVQFQDVSLPFKSSRLNCSAIIEGLQTPKLIDFEGISTLDLAAISNLTGDKPVSLWTKKKGDEGLDCSYVILKDNNEITTHSDVNCSTTNLSFFCERSSDDASLGIENSEINIKEFEASSNYIQPNSFGMMEHKPYFVPLNTIFKKGLFQGAGWCSRTADTNEYLEINFQGTVLISGLTLQCGIVGECYIWTTSFYLQYQRMEKWINISDSNIEGKSAVTIFNSTNNDARDNTTDFWLNNTLTTEKLRLIPLTSRASCSSDKNLNIFCLRLKIFGYYFARENWRLIVDGFDEKIHFRVHSSTDTEIPITWPSGSYAIPMATSGCPIHERDKTVTSVGYILRKVNLTSFDEIPDVSHVSGQFGYFKENVCFHKSHENSSQIDFPPGNYCVYKHTVGCPTGFTISEFTMEKQIMQEDHYVKVTSEGNIEESSYPANYTIYFCCRNDVIGATAMNLSFVHPFFLLPTTNTCTPVRDAPWRLQSLHVTLKNQPDVTGAVNPYQSTNINGTFTLLKLFYCFYEPENNADVISFVVNGDLTFNTNFPFEISVYIQSNGRVVTTGLDANKPIEIHLENLRCAINLENITLLDGKASVSLSKCTQGNGILAVKMTTHKGLTLKATRKLTVTQKVKVLLLVNNEVQTKKTEVLPTMKYKTHNEFVNILSHSLQLDKSRPHRLHLLGMIEQLDTVNSARSIAQMFDLPVLVFNILTSYEETYSNAPQMRFLSSPENSNFRKVLRHPNVRNSNGIIVIRTANAVTHCEFYTLFREKMNLLQDIVINAGGTDLYEKMKNIQSLENSTVILFLDSTQSSIVMRNAINLEITPDNGYVWVSISPEYVVSNAFTRGICFKSTPPCHIVFRNMWNAGHMDIINNCERKPSVVEKLSRGVANLTQLVYNDLLDAVIEDMESITAEILSFGKGGNNRSFDTHSILSYIDSINCLPSGSGLHIISTTEEEKSEETEENIFCQNGWSGALCNTPYCMNSSCNQTHGQCIAPEVCKCNPGRFSLNCNGDCERTCIHGTCNEGMFGDGKCSSCHWLYLGDYCDGKAVIYGFIAAGIGTSVCGLFLVFYVVRSLQTQEQNAEAETEATEDDFTMSWDDLETSEQVDFTTKVTEKQLVKKLQYTSYIKGSTFSGHHVFIKCLEKPNFQLTLGMKTELQQLCHLRHNNLEKVMGIIIGKTHIGIVSLKASMGSLYDILHQKHIPITWDVKYSMMQDICRGMAYLHDVVSIEHGRLKSTNCILHQGWLVKVGDIGLRKIRSRVRPQKKSVNFDVTTADEKAGNKSEVENDGGNDGGDDGDVDYNSLLWTAPELICCGATNLDQIIRFSRKADVYSFGIVLTEIISRCPPFSQIAVMSIDHIVQAVGHLREPITNFGGMNNLSSFDGNGSSEALKDPQQSCLLRPIVENSLFPIDESETSILKILMESCWSDREKERPPFAYCLEVLELITPLKGSHTTKRAILLERETESLEKYIGHDTTQIFREEGKYQDLLVRMLPPSIVSELNRSGSVKPVYHNNITVMALRVCNFGDVLSRCSNTNDAIDVINYLWGAISVISKNRKLNITEINNRGDFVLLGSSLFIPIGSRHAYDITTLATRLMKSIRALTITNNPFVKVALQIGIHSGSAVSVLMTNSYTAGKYTVVGDAVTYAQVLEREGLPNHVHISKKTVSLLNTHEFEFAGRGTFKLKIDKQQMKTFWVISK